MMYNEYRKIVEWRDNRWSESMMSLNMTFMKFPFKKHYFSLRYAQGRTNTQSFNIWSIIPLNEH